MNNIELKHISASSMRSYEMCPLNWYYHYALKLIEPPNPNFIIGKAYHKCLEEFYGGVSVEDMIKNLKKSLISEKPTFAEILRFGTVRKMFEKYLKNPVKGQVIETEKEFSIPISGISIPLYGFIDRRNVDEIIEYKTTSQDYKPEDIRNIQSKIYVYAIWKMTGELLPIKYSVNNKNKVNNDNYKPQVFATQYTIEDMIKLEEEIKEFYNKVTTQRRFVHKQGIFPCPFCHLKSEIILK